MPKRRQNRRGHYPPTSIKPPPGTDAGDFMALRGGAAVALEEEEPMASPAPTPASIPKAVPIARVTHADLEAIMEMISEVKQENDALHERVAKLEDRIERGRLSARKQTTYKPDALATAILEVLEKVAPFGIKLTTKAIAESIMDSTVWPSENSSKSSHVHGRMVTMYKYGMVQRGGDSALGGGGYTYWLDPK